MIKYALGLVILFKSFLGEGQSFTKKTGDVVGNQTVIPIDVAPPGYPQAQALIYYPDDYGKTSKRYPLYLFLHGAGEGALMDISEVNKTSLPYSISTGFKPYGIDKNGDTIKFLVVSPHCAGCNGSYSFPQLQYTVSYLLNNYRIDTNCVVVGGLSSGGSCTWSMVMGNGGSPSWKDTITTSKITIINPMANGGYDEFIKQAQPKANLEWWLKRGGAVLYTIGDQDPGYNPSGYFTYLKEDTTFGVKGRIFNKVVVGGTHSANVWTTPFPLTARTFSPTMNIWQLMWSLRKTAAVVPPPVIVPPPVVIPPISKDTLYPVRVIMKMNDSSCRIIYNRP